MRATKVLLVLLLLAGCEGLIDGGAPAQLERDGATLYATHCAVCHGELPATTRANITLEGLQRAIVEVAAMRTLSSLTLEQQAAIVKVLETKPTTFECTASDEGRALVRPLVRLTSNEYLATLEAMFGPTLAALAPQLALHPTDSLSKTGTIFVGGFAESDTRSLFALADALSTRASTDEATAAAIGLDAACRATPTTTCLTAFTARFGRLALRRPLTTTEVDEFVQLGSAAEASARLKVIIMALLLDPEHLMHVEVGNGQGSDGAVTLSTHEFASRIAYAVTGTMPDAVLRASADSHALDDPNETTRQLARLTTLSSAKAHLERFWRFWLPLSPKAGYPNDVPREYFADDVLADGAQRYAHTQALQSDVTDYLHSMLVADASWSETMTSPVAYPSSDVARKIYGLAPGTLGERRAVAHQGLLQRPFFLLNANGNSNPIYRGKFVLSNVLCRDLAPPADMTAINAAPNGNPVAQSTRELIETKTAAPACQGCHRQFNQYGYALEGFDGLGRARSEESYVLNQQLWAWRSTCDASAAGHDDPLSAQYCPSVRPPYLHPLNLSVTVQFSASERAVETHTPAGFASALATSPTVAECFSRIAYRFQNLRAETPADDCAIARTRASALDSHATLRDTLFGELKSARFRQRRITP